MQTVSVVIPSYNCERYLAAAIESALGQAPVPVEVVVINDGSPGDTDAVVAPYLSRIRYVRQENRGLSAARNRGFREATGAFVCFLDADDLLLPGKLAAQLDAFARDPDLGVVISGYQDVEEDGETVIQAVEKPWHRDGLGRLLKHESFPCHAALIRRDVLEASALFPEDIPRDEYQEDWQLWLDVALSGVAFSSVPAPLCRYRNRPGSGRQRLLRHNDGARRVVRWLSTEPRARVHAAAVHRLAAIVEMERTALLLRAGALDEARVALASAAATNPGFWREPATWQRLFERSQSLHEAALWKDRPDPDRFESTILRRLLGATGETRADRDGRRLRSAAELALADICYGLEDATKSGEHGRRALAEWPGAIASRRCIRPLVRSIVGPRLGRLAGRLRGLGLRATGVRP